MRNGLTIGLVSPSVGDRWLGGVYFLVNCVRAAASVGESNVTFREIAWAGSTAGELFADARDLLGEPVTVSLPSSRWERLVRRAKRWSAANRDSSMRDLFEEAGIDAFFPVCPCENAGVPLFYWLPDAIFREMPDLYPRGLLQQIEERTARALAAAQRVLVCSQAALRDIERHFPEWAYKCRVVFLRSAPSPTWFEADPAETAERYGLPERFVLMSNQIHKHKNHITVFRAVEALRRRGVDVSVACTGLLDEFRDDGFPARLKQDLRSAGLEGQVRFLGVIPKRDQVALLRRSVAVVQPSLFEGWGAAIADSMALGKRVIASDLPVHREHGATSIRYVPALDVEGWAEALREEFGRGSAGPDERAEAAACELNRGAVRRAGEELLRFFREGLDAA